ncbi:MAG TPA: bifunctional ADP-dependent NAD(P)H-hydrate dehydratase/NAD(P)H-hydrate epimerase, partial [Armatimonadetes bacterium]|nr:bifunctional ADP-dependent NAD(P)H-hydrate dehydratase/NAD(P)H-hydrate epimerase [Armatimonadota bacterium]
MPHQLYEEAGVELVGADAAGALLPARPPDAHKDTFGTVVVLAGAAGYTGAAALSSEAVLRAGAGISILATPTSLQPVMSIKLTEVITRGLPETDTQTISSAALPLALELCKKASAVVLGCGLGTHADTCRFVSGFMPLAEVPVVLDADGLNCIAGNSSILEGKHCNLVITPHP